MGEKITKGVAVVNKHERERLEQCEIMDCPIIKECAVYWGKECVHQYGNKVPRFKYHGNPYRRAARRLEKRLSVETFGELGMVVWLNEEEDACTEGSLV